MAEQFDGPRLKIGRAYKHINEIQSLLIEFAASDFYSVRIDYDAEKRANTVCFEIDKLKFPLYDSALAIGDAIHNLRSALDHLWYSVRDALWRDKQQMDSFPNLR